MSMTDFRAFGFGWFPDVPDFRDYTHHHAQVQQLLEQLTRRERPSELPTRVDLREYFRPVRDQGSLRCSSAHACVELLEYFQRRVHGDNTSLAVRFVYKTSLRLKRQKNDCGADLRTTMKGLARFGAPPEEFCPYSEASFADEPDAFLFSCARLVARFVYFRPVSRKASGDVVQNTLRSYLASELPVVFAFGVPDSVWNSSCIDFRPMEYLGSRRSSCRCSWVRRRLSWTNSRSGSVS